MTTGLISSCSAKACMVLCWLAPYSVSAATVVWFDEQEPGTDIYSVRMVIDDDYLRIDDGVERSDYILLDRNKRTIYSVNHEDRTIIEIAAAPVNMAEPDPFVHEVRPQEMKEGPPIKGKEVKLYQLITNDKECGVVAAAKGLLPDVTEALKQYHRTLAGEQAVTAEHMPKQLQNDCDLSENVFRPGAYLELGFPVFHRNSSGRVRSLKSLDENYVPAKDLFALPGDYRRLSPAKLRAGG